MGRGWEEGREGGRRGGVGGGGGGIEGGSEGGMKREEEEGGGDRHNTVYFSVMEICNEEGRHIVTAHYNQGF